VAFVKALVFSVKKPVIGIPSLDVIASGLSFCPHQICTLIDAKQRKVYSAFYCFNDNKLEKTEDYHLGKIEELIPKLKKEKTVLVGDGALLYREFLTEQLGELAIFAKAENHLPKVVVLGRLGIERLKKGQKDDPASLVPMYLYPMDCSIRPKTPSIATTETAEKGA
jgi:tRNA threonylcarbamoyladenosine biosynthesis protein TsaB